MTARKIGLSITTVISTARRIRRGILKMILINNQRIFLDTAFVIALLNRRDKYHNIAKALMDLVRQSPEIWVTEAVLVEIGNALASTDRQGAADFINSCYATAHFIVVPGGDNLMKRAIRLYKNRMDKDWGLTDCISFIIMQDEGLLLALTTDTHFRQAGFVPLMLESEDSF